MTNTPFIPVSYGNQRCAEFVDFNNDGLLDIFFTGSLDIGGWSGSTALYLNNGNSTFTFIEGLPFSGFFGIESDWGDYNNDGYPDLIITTHPVTLSDGAVRIYKNNGDNTFTQKFYLNRGSSIQWIDYNNDGKLDFVLAEGGYFPAPFTIKLYKNLGEDEFSLDENNTFPHSNANFGYSRINCFDYNNDGYTDLVAFSENIYLFKNNCGISFSEETSFNVPLEGGSPSLSFVDYNNDHYLDIFNGDCNIYLNNAGDGTFTPVLLESVLFMSGGKDLADYNNDGLVDILMSGNGPVGEEYDYSKIFRNDGSNAFTDIGGAITSLPWWSTVKWGDYNNDGFLDFIIMGYKHTFPYKLAELYESTGGTNPNTRPVAPANLQSFLNGSSVTLSWDKSSDGQTNSNALTYNVRVGTTPGAGDIVNPMASPEGFRRLARNGNSGTNYDSFKLKYLESGTYYWSVQSIDQAFSGSEFASESSFTIGPVNTLPDTIIECFVDSVHLEGPAGLNEYFWSTGETSQKIWVKSNGTYTLNANDNCDNFYTETFYVNLLNFDLLASDTSLCLGENSTLSVLIHEQPPIDTLPPLPDCLVAYYPFNGNANDESGNGNHGTVYGAALSADRFDRPESAYYFNGASQWIKVNNSSSLNINGESSLTICAWVNTSMSQTQGIACKWGIGGEIDDQYVLAIQNEKYVFGLSDESTFLYTNSQVILDNWVFIAGIYNNSENHSKIYVNGILENTKTNDFFIWNTEQYLAIGSWEGYGYFFNGTLDDIMIFNCALTEEQILNLYKAKSFKEQTVTIDWSTGETSDSVQVSPTGEITYGVTVSDGINSCYQEITIKVHQPDLNFTVSPKQGYAPLAVNFIYTGSDNFMRWEFGDGSSDASSPNITYTYDAPGEYYARVFASTVSPVSCSGFDYVIINVIEEPTIEIPNFFTPNGDGYNDYFYVRTTGMKSIWVDIFDAWGDKINEITTLEGRWDGKTKAGKEAPEGTYFYYLHAKALDNKSYERQGAVLLIRDEVEAWPNPAGDVLNLDLKNCFLGPVTIHILSVAGVRMLSESISETGIVTINISHLPRGYYLLHIVSNDHQAFTNFIKK